MRLRLLIFMAVLVLPCPAFAFKGRVVDHNGQPVAGATVTILGRTGEAVRAADGVDEVLGRCLAGVMQDED